MITTPVGVSRTKIPIIADLYQGKVRDLIAQGLGQNDFQIELLSPGMRTRVEASHIVTDVGRHYLAYRPPMPRTVQPAPGVQPSKPSSRVLTKPILCYIGFMQDPLLPDLDDLLEAETPNELHNTAIYLFKDRAREKSFEWKDYDPVIPNEWSSAFQLKAYWKDDGKNGHAKSRCIGMEMMYTEPRSGIVEAMYRSVCDILDADTARKAEEQKAREKAAKERDKQ